MKLSTKARHAITAMMDLAINDNYKPVTLADISQCQGISLSYLEQLFAKLRKSDLVVGVRGPGGGYRLSRSPNEISVAQVISAIDENVQPQEEHSELSTMQFDDRCITHFSPALEILLRLILGGSLNTSVNLSISASSAFP